jgi:hypothetical protein
VEREFYCVKDLKLRTTSLFSICVSHAPNQYRGEDGKKRKVMPRRALMTYLFLQAAESF